MKGKDHNIGFPESALSSENGDRNIGPGIFENVEIRDRCYDFSSHRNNFLGVYKTSLHYKV
jgi:hypothetical protein